MHVFIVWINFPETYTYTDTYIFKSCPNQSFAAVSSQVAPTWQPPNLHLHFRMCFELILSKLTH